ncbi:copper amine oxidase N-terminal domain-containing protein [Paenibacillus kandeliae]|uniref:copper amine oxidase N-terminal domain-containing protein n=1 Tax=Paenibacillus kandeliae TaxID=3231269 RepID=UPI0034598993
MRERSSRIQNYAAGAIVSLAMVTGTLSPWTATTTVWAAEQNNSQTGIASVLNGQTYLLTDGTLWAQSLKGPWHSEYNFKGITVGSNNQYYGWTTGGQVLTWDDVTGKATIISGISNAAQVSGNGIVLGRDGKINMVGSDKPDTLPMNVKMIDGHEDSYATVNQSGDMFYYSSYRNGLGRKVGSYPDAAAIRQDGVGLAVLKNDGTVVLLDLLTGDAPRTLATDAVSIDWQGNNRTLLVAKKDGTVWSYSRSNGFNPQQLSELTGITEIAASADGIYARRSDGSWVRDVQQSVTPFGVPSITQLKLALSKTDAAIGDKVEAQVQEVYSNGYTSSRPALSGELAVDQPQVAEVLSDGTVKVKALGGATVTLSVDGMTAQAPLNGTSEQALTGAVMISGTVYLPVQSVFKALGGTVAVSGNQFRISWGKDQIVLNKNSAVATINGQKQTLKGKVQSSAGQTVFPAALLTAVSTNAKVSWDGSYKQAILNVNGSKITVQSADTQKLIKQAEIGNLTRLLGKSYWVNGYSGAGDRFSKVTIRDITAEKDPYNHTRFVVHFRGGDGKDYPSSMMTGSEITNLIGDSSEFFTYNPYSKYNWSQSTWNHIKNGEVVRGMTKQQVLLSWGEPDRKEVSKQGGYNVEVWSYISDSSLDMLGFGEGVVYEIVSL